MDYENYLKYRRRYLMIKGGVRGEVYTFMVKSKNIKLDMIRGLFLKRGNWKEVDEGSAEPITFMYLPGSWTKTPLFLTPTTFKNSIDKSINKLVYKNNLHTTLKSKFPSIHSKYMVKYYNIALNTPLPNLSKPAYILKPIRSFKGIGNHIITNHRELEDAIKLSPESIQKYGWILEEYIIDPLLFDSYKFHLRTYFMLVKHETQKMFVFNRSRIIKAQEPYKKSDYTNPKIHDSHHNDQPFIEFPTEFSKLYGDSRADEVFEQIVDLCYYVGKLIDVKCYPDTKYCYHIFGVDIMVLKDFKIKLLEINQYPGMGYNGNEMDEFYESFFDGVLQHVVDVVVEPLNKIGYKDEWTEGGKRGEERRG